MKEKFQELNGIISRNNLNNKNQDQSDVEIDVRSFAKLRSQNISPIIVPNNIRKKQLVNNVFFDFDINQNQMHQGLSYDQVIYPRINNFSRRASPVQNSRNQSFIYEGSFPFENRRNFAQQFNQIDINKSFSQNISPNLQNDNSKNSSTIITLDNKVLFNPFEITKLNKDHIFQMIDMINDKNNYQYNKQTYIMKKINVFSHNYNQAIKKDISSPRSRKSKIQKQNNNKKKFNSSRKKKSKGCNCKNSKCLHRYCECFQAKDHCSANCICINCKNNLHYEGIRTAAIYKKESKDPHAFLTKEERQVIKGDRISDTKKNSKNCNCKKSGCVKKYCNCFQQGMKCGRSCKCKGCENQKKKNQIYQFLIKFDFLIIFFSNQKNNRQIYNLMKFLFLTFILCTMLYTSERSQFWSDIQDQITQRNQLEQQIQETKIQSERNRKTIQDEFIAVDSDENSHMRNFKKISEISNETKDFYLDCLKQIPNNDFTQSRIDECIGKNSFYVINDFDYLFRSILSLYDSRIKQHMIDNCYKDAGTDNVKTNACDVLERDVLEFWWQQYNVPALIEKYLKKIYEEQSELLDEAYNHRDVTVQKLTETIDDKTKIIQDLAKRDSSIHPMRFKHKITLTEEVDGQKIPNKEDDLNLEEFKKQYAESEFTNYEDDGPNVFIPSKKKEI